MYLQGKAASAADFAKVTYTNFVFGTGIPAVEGDYNNNGVVDAADYVLWRNGGPLQNDPTPGVQDPEDYTFWRSRFGADTPIGPGLSAGSAVPEPTTSLLGLVALAGAVGLLRRR